MIYVSMLVKLYLLFLPEGDHEIYYANEFLEIIGKYYTCIILLIKGITGVLK